MRFEVVIISLFGFVPLALHPQLKKSVAAPDSLVIKKWTRACINLQGKPNLFTSTKFVEMQRQGLNEGKLDPKQTWRTQDSTFHTRYSGTAIYLIYNHKHYLVTARHVIEDASSYFPDVFQFIYLIENGSRLNDSLGAFSPDPFRFYFNATLARPVNEVPVIWSTKSIDMAIISLDNVQLGKQFYEKLEFDGYVAITEKDIDTSGSLKPGDTILAFGFPEFSEVARMQIPTHVFGNDIIPFTLPVVTKGYIEDPIAKNSTYFTGNIFIYHGFSGGAAVRNNKLVGINDAIWPKKEKLALDRIPLYIRAKEVFIKSIYILPMIRELERRLGSKESIVGYRAPEWTQ